MFLWGPALPSTATWVSRALGRQASGEDNTLDSPDALVPTLLSLHKSHPQANVIYLVDPTRGKTGVGGGREAVITC